MWFCSRSRSRGNPIQMIPAHFLCSSLSCVCAGHILLYTASSLIRSARIEMEIISHLLLLHLLLLAHIPCARHRKLCCALCEAVTSNEETSRSNQPNVKTFSRGEEEKHRNNFFTQIPKQMSLASPESHVFRFNAGPRYKDGDDDR